MPGSSGPNQGIFHHFQLQPLIWYLLFSQVRPYPIKQFNPNSLVFHPVPQLPQFRRHRPGGDGFSHRTVGMGQTQHILESNPHPVARVYVLVAFLGNALGLYEDIGVIPGERTLLP